MYVVSSESELVVLVDSLHHFADVGLTLTEIFLLNFIGARGGKSLIPFNSIPEAVFPKIEPRLRVNIEFPSVKRGNRFWISPKKSEKRIPFYLLVN